MPFVFKIMEPDGAGGFDEVARLDGVTTAGPVWTAPITYVLNSIGACAFDLSLTDPDHLAVLDALAVDWLKREVWIYELFPDLPYPWPGPVAPVDDPLDGAAPVWQGVPIRPSKGVGSGVVNVQCAEVLWHLTRRHFGRTDRTNYINPGASFEGGLGGSWAFGGPGSGTDGVDNDQAKLGADSAWLDGAAADDRFVEESFGFTSGGIGNVLVVAGWYYIEPTGADGTSFEQRLLYAEWHIGGIVQQTAFVKLDPANYVTGTWVRAEIPINSTLRVPPNTTVTVNVRGYGIVGTIRWDAMLAVVMESFSSAQPGGSDLATLAAGMVNHAQDGAYDKDDLSFDLDTPATGRLLTRAWQFADHANIWTAGLNELIGREDGIDVWMTYEADGRTFHTASRVGADLGRGVDRTANDLTLANYATVYGYGYTKDGAQAANSVTVLGDGDGPDREEGGYLNLSAFGGRALELILQAPADSDIDGLDQRARKTGAARANATILQLYVRRGGSDYMPGDRVTIPAYDPLVEPGVYRIMDVALNPATGARTLGLNPFILD